MIQEGLPGPASQHNTNIMWVLRRNQSALPHSASSHLEKHKWKLISKDVQILRAQPRLQVKCPSLHAPKILRRL